MEFFWVEGGWPLAALTEKIAKTRPAAADPHLIRSLPVLVVHAHTSCNCRCLMCDIWKSSPGKALRAHNLQPHVDSIRRMGVRWIVFSGGEPLMNPELPELCAMLREESIRLTLLTTGLLLGKNAEHVASSFDDVIVSLDGPPAVHDAIRRVAGGFSLLRTGVDALRERRNDFHVTARTVVQKANYAHLRETARAARSLRLNAISFLAADLTSTAFNRPQGWPVIRQEEVGLTHAELSVLESEIELLIQEASRDWGEGFLSESPEKLRRIARHFRVSLGLEKSESPVCNAPWVSAVVETDGTVRPCFFHRPIGNLGKQSLEEVINGVSAREFRQELDIASNPICNRCVCSLNYRL
jgi:MoaA/NifB/PqqE/SkfB family radical SAM enzyme